MAAGPPVRDKTPEDQAWVERLLLERWGGKVIIVHGVPFDAASLPALVAGDREGLATYRIDEKAELISLDAVTPGCGVGTTLILELAQRLRSVGVRKLWVTTTNDNLSALRFYQRRGFRLARVHAGAIDVARRLKPAIPMFGQHGIPIRDEIDLYLCLCEPTASN
jgi:GNAT superfamily N-acetyltransferase